MKTIILILGSCLIMSSAFSQQVEYEWIKNIGSPSKDYFGAMVIDNLNNVVITGYIEDTTHLNFNLFVNKGFFIAKFNENGNLIWIKQTNKPEKNENADGIQLAIDNENNIYVAGIFGDTLFWGQDTLLVENSMFYSENWYLAQLDPNGNLMELKHLYIGQSFDQFGKISDMKCDENKNLYLCGRTINRLVYNYTDTLISNSNGNIGFLCKIDSSKTVDWIIEKNQNSLVWDGNWAYSLFLDLNGNVFMSGNFYDTVLTNDETVILEKYNSDGIFQWDVKAKDLDGTSVKVDQFNNIILTGNFANNAYIVSNQHPLLNTGIKSFYIAKFNQNGALDWVVQPDYSTWSASQAITIDNSNDIYVAGLFKNDLIIGNDSVNSPNYSNSYGDIFISKLTINGQFKWIGVISSMTYFFDSWKTIQIEFNQDLYIAATFRDTIISDTNQLISFGEDDLFISKIKEPNTFINTYNDKKWQIKVFPNPVNHILNISLTNYNGKIQYDILDLKGRILKSGIFNRNENIIQIDVTFLDPGLYISSIKNGLITIRQKFIKL